MIKAVIFDQDGVLVDSEPVYIKCFKDFLDANDIHLDLEEIYTLAGCSGEMEKILLAKWWNQAKGDNLSPQEVYKMCERFWEVTGAEKNFSYKDIPNPHVKEVISTLKKDGYIVAIASSSPMDNIKHVAKEIGVSSYIDLIVSGHMFKESKPNPEIYNYTVSKLGLDKEECLVIEDSTDGIQAAKAAGLVTVAKKDDRFSYNQSPADYKIDDLIEILDIVKMKNENSV